MKKKITALLLAVTMVLSMLTIPVSATEVSESAKLEITPSVTSVDSAGEAIKVVYTITIKPAIGQKIGAIEFTFDVPEGMELSQKSLPKSASNEGGSGYWINKNGLFYDGEDVTSNCLSEDGNASYTVSTQKFTCYGGTEEYNITESKKLMTIEATIAADQIGTFTLSAKNIDVYHYNGVDSYDCTAETTALMVNGVLNGIQPVADLSAPAKLTAPDTEVTAPAHTTASVKWYYGENEVTGNFATSTQYKAVITVMPDTGYRFGSNVSFTVNGESWAVSDGQNGTKVLSKTFEATAAKELSSIAVTTAPTKTTYVVDEIFSDDGMVVTATYDDGTSETVTKYTYTPNGALAATNTDITVSYEGKTATQGITVNKKDLTRDDFAYTDGSVTYDGNDHIADVAPSIKGLAESLTGALQVLIKLDGQVQTELKNAGEYTVIGTTPGGEKYNSSEIELGTFTINKAAIEPSVSLEGWTYGETAKNPSVSGNTGNGTVTYSYKAKDAEDSAYSSTVPSNAGSYTVKATVAESANYQGGEATADFTIAKAAVTAPTISAKTYNGEKQIADIAESDLYTVTSNEGGTTVGDYNVVLTLTDSANYKWTDSEEAAKTLSFRITQATAPAVTAPTPGAVTYDPNKTLANVTLPDGWNWTDGAVVPTVGNNGYAAALTVDDANYDYTGVEGYDAQSHTVTRTVPLTVNKANSTAATVTPNESLTYDGTVQSLVTVTGTATGGKMQYKLDNGDWRDDIPSATNAGEYTVYYKVAGDANHNDTESVTVTVTIAKATVTAPTISAKTYNGQNQTANVAANDRYTVTTNEGGTTVGAYDVVLTLKDSANYKWEDSDEAAKTLSFQITKATAPAVTAPTPDAVTYDPNKTLADVTLPNGWSWTNGAVVPTVDNSGYAANLTVDDANYDYTGVEGYDAQSHTVTRTVSLTVTKAAIAQAQLSGSMTVRSKTAKAVTFTLPALPEGASYGDPAIGTNTDGLISSAAAPTVSGTTLSFSVNSRDADKTATITVPVNGGNNYNDATYTLTVTSQDKDDAGVTVTADSTVTYGDSLAVTGSAKSEAGSGAWTWSSSNSAVVAVSGTGANPTVTVKGAGEATITGTFENDDYLGSNTVTVTVTKREVTLNWGASIFTYDGKSHVPAVTLGNVKNGDTVNVTVTGQQTNAGTNYTATAESLDNGNYKLPEAKTRSFTINKAASDVTTPPAANTLTYTGSAQALVTAGTATGGTMQYSLDGTNYSTDIPTGIDTGSYTVYYKVLGDENHNNTESASVTVAIAKAYAAYTAPAAKTGLIYNGQAQALVDAGSTDDGTMQYKLDNGTWGTTVPTATNAGSYTVYYKVVGDKNHEDVTEKSVPVTIARKAVTVTADNATKVYGAADPGSFTATVSGTVGSDKVTYTLSRAAGDNVGAYDITASGNATQGNYDVTFKKGTFTITKATNAVSNLTISGWTYGDKANAPSASATFGTVAYTYGSAQDGPFTATVPVNAGTWYVKAAVAGNDNYGDAQAVTSFTIAPKAVTITANNATKVYGESDPTLTVTVTGVVSGDDIPASALRAAGNNVNTYTISVNVSTEGNYLPDNYTITTVPGTFTITPKAVTVTADDAEKTYGQNDPVLSATVTGVVDDDVITYDVTRQQGENAGQYTITASGAATQGNYTVTYVAGKFTVKPLTGEEVVAGEGVSQMEDNQTKEFTEDLAQVEQFTDEAVGIQEGDDDAVKQEKREAAVKNAMVSAAKLSNAGTSGLYFVNANSAADSQIVLAVPNGAANSSRFNYKVMYMAADGTVTEVSSQVTANGIVADLAQGANGVYMVAYTPKPVHVVDDSASASGGQSIITDLTDINKVTVDGKTVDPKYYTVSGGVVTLSEAYLRTLSNGKHTVRVENAKYISTAVITVSNSTVKSAGTGDAGLGLYAMLALSSVTGAAWLGLKKRKED